MPDETGANLAVAIFCVGYIPLHTPPPAPRLAKQYNQHQPHNYANATVFIVVAASAAIAFALYLFRKVQAVP